MRRWSVPRLIANLGWLVVSTPLLSGCSDFNGPIVGGRVILTSDTTVMLDALQAQYKIQAYAVDTAGRLVPRSYIQFASSDSSVASVSSDGVVHSQANGLARITMWVSDGGQRDSLTVVVQQKAVTLSASLPDTLPLVGLSAGEHIPVQCEARDRNGFVVSPAPTGLSLHGLVPPATCDGLSALHSGLDTLVISSGSLVRRLPVAIALRPIVVLPGGMPLPADSVPTGVFPWAPTLTRAPSGELYLYATGYFNDTVAPARPRGDLQRFVSSDDGLSWRFDGVALARDTIPCSLSGDGIENIAIAPRPDGPGWRMFLSAGGFTCYGWQVLSAVSLDQRSWTLEAGVRISNGTAPPPSPPPTDIPWPAGEGIVVDQLPDGTWRMIVGAYENTLPSEGKFQITEWRSQDQLSWTYKAAILRTDDVGPSASRSIYSPTIREFAPGLYRMIFTGDDLQSGGRSRLYSAVSLDREHWRVEGVLMSDPGADFFYSTLVDQLLVFIRQDIGQPRYLASTTVSMP